MVEFKNALKLIYVPIKYKFLSRGDKKGNKLLTQIRIGRSYLNSHSFAIQMSPSPECSCHFPNESSTHFFLDCFMWTEERRTMLGVLSISFLHFQLSPNRKNLTLYSMVMIETMRHCLAQMLVCNMLLKILLSTPKGLIIIPKISSFLSLSFVLLNFLIFNINPPPTTSPSLATKHSTIVNCNIVFLIFLFHQQKTQQH